MLTDFPIQRILDHLVQRIVGVLPVTAAGVTLIAPGSQPRYIAASDAEAMLFEQLQTDLAEGPCLAAYQTGQAVTVPDLRQEGRFPTFAPHAISAGLSAVFTFPLRHGDAQMGALDLYRSTPGPLDASTMAAAQTLADVAAAYLLNAQARDELRDASDRFHHRSLHDALTGLPNRVLLLDRVDHALRRSRRTGRAMTVAFADLDGLKEVNDLHGHLAGDELLVAVADRLRGLLRATDTLGRMAGDEFVIVCEDLNGELEDAEAIARRIDVAFARAFSLSSCVVAATLSTGFAIVGPTDQSPEELLHVADTAMYEVKRSGGAGYRIVRLDQEQARPRRRATSDVEVPQVSPDESTIHGSPPPEAFAEGGALAEAAALLATERDRSQSLKAQLGNLADHDPLTDLLSRRSIEDELERHLDRCARYGPEGALILVGVDGVLDSASAERQQERDEALAALARLVLERLRTTDLVGRWGADELAILIPRGPVAGVASLVPALARIVRESGTERVPPGSLTASIGVAPVLAGLMDPAELVARARRSMNDVRLAG